MTRTYIINSEGTRFVPVTLRARITRRIIGGIALLITALFLSAAIIGLQRAAIADSTPHAAPTATTLISLPAAKRACARAPRGSGQDCLNLYMRHAWTSPSNGAAEGRVLVRECFDQYRGAELRDCFTQEIG